MKIILYTLLIILLSSGELLAQGVTKNGESISNSTNFINRNGKIFNSSLLNKKGQVLVIPTLTTATVTPAIGGVAASGGNITKDGGASVTARGVCWSTSANPTTANNLTIDGSGTGIFTSSITGLTLGTKYYVRAYATSSAGTAYGNEISFTALAIGDNYQGGLVAYILNSADPGYVSGETHGIISSTVDQGAPQWGCYGTAIGTTSSGIGTGSANTAAIVAGCTTAGIAAKICYDLVLNTYSDWYLPSQSELNLLRLNLHLHGLGNFGLAYWSSTEGHAIFAWGLYFNGSGNIACNKDGSLNVRAVRSF